MSQTDNGPAAFAEIKPLTITFRVPLQLADNKWASMTLKEPTARQMEEAAVPDNQITSNILLIAAVSGINAEALRDLPMRELLQATRYLNSFS